MGQIENEVSQRKNKISQIENEVKLKNGTRTVK